MTEAANRRVLVTGGAGFLGSHLCEALLARGDAVRCVDNLSTGRLENLTACREHPDFEFLQRDLGEPEAAAEAVPGCSAIIHLAALISVPQSVAEPEKSRRDTFLSTRYLLQAAQGEGIPRFVFASSAAIYGEGTPPCREDAPPDPRSPYAEHKLASEAEIRKFSALGVDGVCLRLFNFYGPRQRPDSSYAGAIPGIAGRLLRGEPVRIFGDGRQTRDFIFVGDVVRAILRALDGTQRFEGRAVNIASGWAISVLELANTLAGLLGIPPEYVFEAERAGDIRFSAADVSRARDLLGFSAETPLDQGLAATLSWLKSAPGLG